jgi:hypothetical protein
VDIRWMVGAAGLVVLVILYGRWWKKINSGFATAAKWMWKFLIHPTTCKVAETFCVEVAVLWFVFPLLDTLYQHGKLDDPLLRQAGWVAGIFLVFAVILSHLGEKKKEV